MTLQLSFSYFYTSYPECGLGFSLAIMFSSFANDKSQQLYQSWPSPWIYYSVKQSGKRLFWPDKNMRKMLAKEYIMKLSIN